MENTKTILNRALIYLRVSTDRQAEKGIAIPTQQDRCLEHARELGFEFDQETDLYIDRGESARSMDRPALLEMLNRCETDRSIKAIIVYDVSRLARDRIDFALIKRDLKKRGIKLVSATEPINDSPEGQILEGVLSSVAEFFSTQNARKVKANMMKKAKDGCWPSRPPYGYKNVQEKVSTGKVRAWIEVCWTEAKWVIRAFELFATGNYSVKALALKLQEEGFAVRKDNRSSGKLHVSSLERMLRNKFYIGVIEWGDVVSDGKHELFLDRSLFERAQAILDARLGGGSRNRRLFSIIKPISFCEECGSRMTAEEAQTSSGRTIRYLRCLKRQHSESVECEQAYTHEDIYLKQFTSLMGKVELPERSIEKLRARVKAIFSDEQKIYEHTRKDLLSKIEETKRKKKNLVIKLIDTESTKPADVELYDEIKTDLEKEEVRLTDELNKAEGKIGGVLRTIEIALSLTANCLYAYERVKEPELKALLAKTIFKTLHIQDGEIVRAVLNEPLDYLCAKKLRKYPVFDLASVGGPTGSRTPTFPMAIGT